MSLYIDDDNYTSVVVESENAGFTAGALPRQTNIGDLACAPVFAEHIPLIPESKWKNLIESMAANSAFIGQRWKSNVKADFQNGLGFCWGYSLCQSAMSVMHSMKQNPVQLSPESLAELTGYRNAGYYLDRAIEYASTYGIATRATVPQHKINPSQWSPEYKIERQNFMPTEWWDLGGKDVWAETVTALLQGWGCYVGYDWWRHAVFLDMLRVNNGKIEVHTPNSHGQGNDAWIAGSKAIPSMGSFVLRSMTLSGLAI
jgi:hypothetical protein